MYGPDFQRFLNDEKLIKRVSTILIVSAIAIFVIQLINCFSHSDLGDFFWVVEFVQDLNPYVDAEIYGYIANYPPLAYVFFYPFYLLTSLGGAIYTPENPWGVVSCLIFMLVPLAVTIVFLLKNTGKSLFFSSVLVFLILTGLPVHFEINRANINIIVLMFVVIFMSWKDSEEKWKRDVAIVCLAVAGAVKLYPAFLGILLIRDRRWKDCLKTVLYSVFLFIVPFLAFKGGLANISLFFSSVGDFSDMNSGVFNPYDLAIAKTFRSFALIFGMDQSIATSIGMVVSVVFLILACFVIISVRDEIKAVFLAVVVLTIVPNPNYAYSTLYALVPLALIIGALANENLETDKKIEYMFLLAIFVILSYFAYQFSFITFLGYIGYAVYMHINKQIHPWPLALIVFSSLMLLLTLVARDSATYLEQIALASSLIIIGIYLVSTNLKDALKFDYRRWLLYGQRD